MKYMVTATLGANVRSGAIAPYRETRNLNFRITFEPLREVRRPPVHLATFR
jgi:hypothetical protein